MQGDVSGSGENDHPELQPSLLSQDPMHFDWENRWLKGHEYAHMLKNVERYSQKFGIQKYPPKTHPPEIY